MIRQAVLGLAHRKFVRRLATGGIGRRVALRFVAGEDLADALQVVRRLNATGADVSIDCLGENVTDLAAATQAASLYAEAIERIHSANLRASVSLKLTQMGLDIDPDAAFANASMITARAADAGTTVTLDMEDHRYTDRTVDACLRLAGDYPERVGIAVQAYLHRTPKDLERLIDARVHVRLCKGAYKEDTEVALTKRDAVDAAYAALSVRLLTSEAYAMIATHDERLVDHAIRQVERVGRARDTFEFQMLYGVRRELQRRLVERGYRLRIYVPFGSQWYPYLTRRIAERPANIRFFAEALLRR